MPKKYLCLANSLIEQITEGVYPKGCLLPSEREICEKYNWKICHISQEKLLFFGRITLTNEG